MRNHGRNQNPDSQVSDVGSRTHELAARLIRQARLATALHLAIQARSNANLASTADLSGATDQ